VCDLTILIGNHELATPSTYLSGTHPFTALRKWPRVRVVDTQCEVFEVCGQRFAAVPYTPPGRFVEALHTNPHYDDDVVAIFAHQEFVGCCMDRVYSKSGDVWSDNLPIVISGHIHSHSRLGPNIRYVGTPRQVSFADPLDTLKDGTEDKTVSLFTFNDDSWSEMRIPTRIPPKLEFCIRSDEVQSFRPPRDGSIRVRVTGGYEANKAVREHPNVLAWKRRGVTVTFRDTHSRTHSVYKDRDNKRVTFIDLMMERVRGDSVKEELFDEVRRERRR
jgi:hypothetical protein